MENKTVLLLGGTGTLSTAVLLRAKLKGYKITIMNRGSNNRKVPADVDVRIVQHSNILSIFASLNLQIANLM